MEGMKYRIEPSNGELEKVREKVETAIKSYEHLVEVEEVEIDLSWQRFEKPTSSVTSKEAISLIIDPRKEYSEGIQKTVLKALLEVEFLQKKEETLNFGWQEVCQKAYVMSRESEITGKGIAEPEVKENWEKIRKAIKEDDLEFLYNHSPGLSSRLAEKLEKEKIMRLKRSDLIETLKEELK